MKTIYSIIILSTIINFITLFLRIINFIFNQNLFLNISLHESFSLDISSKDLVAPKVETEKVEEEEIISPNSNLNHTGGDNNFSGDGGSSSNIFKFFASVKYYLICGSFIYTLLLGISALIAYKMYYYNLNTYLVDLELNLVKDIANNFNSVSYPPFNGCIKRAGDRYYID